MFVPINPLSLSLFTNFRSQEWDVIKAKSQFRYFLVVNKKLLVLVIKLTDWASIKSMPEKAWFS